MKEPPLRVLIAGAGAAGLEATLALRDLAGDRVAVTLLAPQADFVYRPLRVREPFGYAKARSYPLDEIASDIGAALKPGAVGSVDADRQVLRTREGEELAYDALLLAPGARLRQQLEHASLLDDRRLDEQLHGLIQDVEAGDTGELAFLIPTQPAWPLPIYELALMTARRAWDMNVEVSITIVTPEEAPLAVFGSAASQAVAQLLEEHRVQIVTSAHAETPAPGRVSIHPGGRSLSLDRVMALPELVGPSIPALPKPAGESFIPVDLNLPAGLSLGSIPEIRVGSPRTQSVVLTMQNEPAYARQALASGALGYVLKEAAESELVEAVRRAAEGDAYLNPRLGARVAAEPPAGPPDGLSEREVEILQMIALGHTNTEIAPSSSTCRYGPSRPTALIYSRSCDSPHVPNSSATRSSTG